MNELASASLAEASSLLDSRDASSEELLDASLNVIEHLEARVHALVEVLPQQAREQARQADQERSLGKKRGPLHGIPLVIKDLIDLAGAHTRAGSRILHHNLAHSDAPVVAALRQAGAVLLAKANTHEFAFGALTPPTRNPWDLDRMPGGSSGGTAAALAAHMAYGGLGTDTAGSIREPACLCGLAGLKPTYGRISRNGVIPLAPSLDTIGTMARTVEDLELLQNVIDPLAPGGGGRMRWTQPPERLAGLRVAVAAELTSPLQAGVEDAFKHALRRIEAAGADLVEASIGDPDEMLAVAFIVIGCEALSYHRAWMESVPHLYSAEVLRYLLLGTHYGGGDYIDAQRVRAHYQHRLATILAQADVLISPSQAVAAPAVTDKTVRFESGLEAPRDLTLIRPLVPFSLTGLPALTIPTKLTAARLPTGLQIVGGAGQDRELLALGRRMVEVLELPRLAPPLTAS